MLLKFAVAMNEHFWGRAVRGARVGLGVSLSDGRIISVLILYQSLCYEFKIISCGPKVHIYPL